ncbi:helix-turn-helix transcriptional regulator [Flagellimonas lutaonensis]|uniref:DNA-binding protein n=1 Tax=Flagellimonas lutaonensis TaxID=516051 RepID=A0A0D5YWQ1_9FLAO|nr:helix-turn-helix transcriptional regulator [Allomuricauda lutaonensis]AKA36283.1 DNA-binding protein [Allomuricauda lutaonensis]
MNNDFVERLKTLIDHYELSPSLFADRIGMQRSSISHLLNGRNRPSLDFVMKVIKTFPEVNIYWLLNGKGSFPGQSKNGGDEDNIEASPLPPKKISISEGKKPIRIVVFYEDGTFEDFEPKK